MKNPITVMRLDEWENPSWVPVFVHRNKQCRMYTVRSRGASYYRVLNLISSTGRKEYFNGSLVTTYFRRFCHGQ